jgi:hypothetical protein
MQAAGQLAQLLERERELVGGAGQQVARARRVALQLGLG